jgi:sialate O-acetylesterase
MHRFRAIILSAALTALTSLACNAADQAAPARAGGFVSTLFADHMVVQRGSRIPVWGWTTPGAKVAVSLAGNTAEAVAGADGKWMAWLPPMTAGGPHVLQISGPESRTVSDVLVGDVWICSGQSNMEWSVASSLNAPAEIAAADLPWLRQLKVAKKPAVLPQADFTGEWTVASPTTVAPWTAVGFFFGRDLQAAIDVPIGLINTSWGGTRVEAWTSREVMASLTDAQKDIEGLDTLTRNFAELSAKSAEMQKAWDAGKAQLVAFETDAAHQQRLAAPDLDDSQWKEIKTPADWDSQGYKGVKGEAWYRKSVEIPAAWAGKDLELSPGAADEIETSYFNGVKVGSTGSVVPWNTDAWNKQRSYTVPAALVKPGKALIAVRVANLVGEGGLRSNGDAAFMYLRPVGAEAKDGISLAGPWRFDFAIRMTEPLNANPNVASVLYNGMINPLIPFPVKGAIWYQGESNAGNAFAYRERFPAMITDWRTRWGSDFTFLWVQLANFREPQTKPVADNWAVVRESQERTLALPKTGTALAIDIGAAKDIHPKDKQTVGARLALAARSVAYGEKLVFSGPRYAAMTVEGGKVRLRFDHVGGGLVARDGELRRFAIAGADQVFSWAQARIEGDGVVVWSDQVASPVAVRYAYETNPEGANLYNREGLPAAPFRTDDWPVPTQPKK